MKQIPWFVLRILAIVITVGMAACSGQSAYPADDRAIVSMEAERQQDSFSDDDDGWKPQSSAVVPKPQVLTVQNANRFVADVLSTLTVHQDNTASFTLPETIPVDPQGKTHLTVTMNAVYVQSAGVYTVKRFLDNARDWTGGAHYTAELSSDDGQLERIMLRAAFMTEVGDGQYQQYSADYVELSAPFSYGQPAIPTSPGTFTQDGQHLSARYQTAEGRSFTIRLTLPDGVAGAMSQEDTVSGGLSPYAPILLLRDGVSIGSFSPVRYGAADAQTLDDLRQSQSSDTDFPLQIYAPVALSNMVNWNTDTLTTHRLAAGNTTTLCYPTVDGEKIADCVLAYNLDSEPYFLYLSLKPGALTPDELTQLALEVSFSTKPRQKSVAAED